MNGFLVLRRHNFDDFPVALCPTMDDAMRVANEQTEELEDSVNIFSADITGFIGVDIVEFKDGRPVSVQFAKLVD